MCLYDIQKIQLTETDINEIKILNTVTTRINKKNLQLKDHKDKFGHTGLLVKRSSLLNTWQQRTIADHVRKQTIVLQGSLFFLQSIFTDFTSFNFLADILNFFYHDMFPSFFIIDILRRKKIIVAEWQRFFYILKYDERLWTWNFISFMELL